jgi:hypothetical protein
VLCKRSMAQIGNAPANSIILMECKFEHIRPSLVLSAHRSSRFPSVAFMKIAVGFGWDGTWVENGAMGEAGSVKHHDSRPHPSR